MNNGIYHCSEWDNRQEVFCVLPYVCSADIAGPNVVILLLYCEKKKLNPWNMKQAMMMAMRRIPSDPVSYYVTPPIYPDLSRSIPP